LVFWDETWLITAMTPLYGRAPAGQRVVEYVPHGRWERLTLTAGIRLGGVCGALVFAGGATAEACEAFAAQCLGPQLRAGDIVIMDNLPSHGHPEVLAALRQRGVQVKQLPPYSPDLNPIEEAFSKAKQAVRRARPRTVPALIEAIAAALRAITPADIRGWFTHCGYHTDS
jgi:transposase